VSTDGGRGVGDRIEDALEHRADVEGEIARGEEQQPSRMRLLHKAVWLGLTGVSLYLVAPALIDSLATLPELRTIAPEWLGLMAGLQAGAVVCLWQVQRVSMHTREWYPVATSQLASNGMAKIAPGGGAVGAALQYRMLTQAGMERPAIVSGLTTSNLLTLAIVLALPVLALPALLTGGVNQGLLRAALGGLALLAVMFAAGAVLLAADRPLQWVGEVIQTARNRLRRRAEPLRLLPQRLLRERNRILTTVGRRWKAALAAGIGRWLLDYASLLAALAAVGADPRPGLVLLAFCTAQLLAQIPVTPGGLGFVEAGLTATLGLAGVSAGAAVLATLAYRLFTYWLPMPLGVLGAALHRWRYAGARAVGA
jgi:uncharacterized membrane protein YbhN (UPF0104 family)